MSSSLMHFKVADKYNMWPFSLVLGVAGHARVCVCVRACSAHLRYYVNTLQLSAFRYPGLYTRHLWYKLLHFFPARLVTVFCVWSHSECPFAFCSPFCCVSLCPLHASVSAAAALPPGFWFMISILVCHYRLQKGALMGQYVESVTRRIALCPQTSWIFLWQPVACSVADLDTVI